jgi:sortase A
MQKGKSARVVFVLAGLLLLVWGGFSLRADGAERIDSSRKCRLTITCKYDGVPLEDEKFDLYRIEDVTKDGELSVTEEFAGYGVDFTKLLSEDGEDFSDMLAGYVKRDGIKPQCTGVSDEKGIVTFQEEKNGLQDGVYLVIGGSVAVKDVTYTTKSFIVSVPSMTEKKGYDYDVEVTPKYERQTEKKDVDLSVVKLWKDEGSESLRPESVTVQLLNGSEVYDTQTLNLENSWRYTWTGLAGDGDWNIVEKEVPDGYTVSSYQEGEIVSITNTISDTSGKGSKTGDGQSLIGTTPGKSVLTDIVSQAKKKIVSYFSGKGKKKTKTNKSTSASNPQTDSDSDRLPQTGLCWWPVPLLLVAGLLLIIVKTLRGKKGHLAVWFGILLILVAFGLTGYNYRESERAGGESQAAMEQLDRQIPDQSETDAAKKVSFEPNPDMEMPVIKVNGYEYVGKLKIPTLGLTLPVLNSWSYPGLRVAPCRYKGSAYRSNMVIAAHNYSTHFGRINELATGDDVIFIDADGNEFDYQVIDLEILDPTDVKKMTQGDWDLTLFTCTIGGRSRVTVRCKAVEEDDAT